MATNLVRTCDECGDIATVWVHLATGRVVVDGMDRGQDVDLCDAHRPEGMPSQPKDCEKVEFHWPGG